MSIQLSPVVALSPVESCLMFGVHPEWNVRNLQSACLPNGRIWVSFTCKDDSPLSTDRLRHPDVPISRTLDDETDLYAWARSMYYSLEAVKKNFSGPTRLP